MAILLHALAALVLGNFRLASFLKRAHSVSICEPGFNHLIRSDATQFFNCVIQCSRKDAIERDVEAACS